MKVRQLTIASNSCITYFFYTPFPNFWDYQTTLFSKNANHDFEITKRLTTKIAFKEM
jgi:hypothetical protein